MAWLCAPQSANDTCMVYSYSHASRMRTDNISRHNQPSQVSHARQQSIGQNIRRVIVIFNEIELTVSHPDLPKINPISSPVCIPILSNVYDCIVFLVDCTNLDQHTSLYTITGSYTNYTLTHTRNICPDEACHNSIRHFRVLFPVPETLNPATTYPLWLEPAHKKISYVDPKCGLPLFSE